MIIKINNTAALECRSPVAHILLPPLPPIALPATDITINSFFSNWYSEALVSGFDIDVATDSGFSSFVTRHVLTGDVSTYMIIGLDCSTDYYYRIRSYEVSYLPSTDSNIISLGTKFLTVPDILVETSINVTGFKVNWISTTDASGYYLDVAYNPTFSSLIPPYNPKDISIADASIYTVSGIPPDTSYYYRIRSYAGSCMSDDSSVNTVKTIPLPIPDVLPATNIDFNSFNANWIDVSLDVPGYYLDVATDISFTSFVPGYNNLDVLHTVTSIVSGLDSSTTYYYRVRCYFDEYIGNNSNIIETITT